MNGKHFPQGCRMFFTATGSFLIKWWISSLFMFCVLGEVFSVVKVGKRINKRTTIAGDFPGFSRMNAIIFMKIFDGMWIMMPNDFYYHI
ncbi:hypothetical protein IIF46_004824 [Salmonella enterica]|nr:hypothetical protein [Salmonella enterica]